MKCYSEKQVLNSGRNIEIFTLENDNNMSVEILGLGATLRKVMYADKDGNIENVLLGWKDLNLYDNDPECKRDPNPGNLGGLMARTAGRVADAKITIDGVCYKLTDNNNGSTLHGGNIGFQRVDWTGKVYEEDGQVCCELTYTSPDGTDGYPGNLTATVIYSLNNDDELTLTYKAVTDKATLYNPTNHAYFNLSGNAKREIYNEVLQLNADSIGEVDENRIPTGGLLKVADETAFDFRKPRRISDGLEEENIHVTRANGYDHAWFVNDGKECVKLYDEESGRTLTVSTNQPCIVIYTMNFADDPFEVIGDVVQRPKLAICFEAQKPAVGHNEVGRDDVILRPGEEYNQVTTFKFGLK